ncbi:extracellular solute-binding protein [Lachnotalea sp. AF33-28]|uniref:extracellular solute-binding protein n=1 Tax=Lachnotalea sp. AF33-28 TaxID=2292046 RepID=UPI000E46BC19|nr:extracellular solute-binding protein [Lachnotalea sp. AF33-28]RHP30284.1 extracellular solute-binding protein [Lachnotalea sp. AF33-28]
MKKKLLSLLLIMAMAVVMLAGCSKGGDKETQAAGTTAGGETTKGADEQTTAGAGTEAQTVTMWTWKGTEELMKMDTKDVMAVQEISKRTGVPTEWINPADSTTEFQMLMTSGENMPDAMYYKYTPQDVMNYAANGNIIDLSKYIEEKIPNLKKLLDENPRLKAQVTSEDGAIYYLPWITLDKYYYEGLMIRKDWLEATGLDVPTNNEELYQVLKAEKELFDKGELPNAGEKFYGLGGYPTQLIKLAYGFDATNDFMLKDGKVVYGPTTEEFREAMKWFNKLATEGLLDPDVLSMDRDVYMQHHVNNMTSGFVDGYGAFQEVEQQAENIEYVPVGYMANAAGKIMEYNSTAKRIAQPYGWAITKAGEEKIDEICKLFDYSYSEEGQILMSWGIEGDTFEVVDGKKVYTDKIMKDPEYVPGTAVAKYVKPDFGLTDVQTNFALIDERGQTTFSMWANTDPSNAMEPFLWTSADENDTISQIKTDLVTGADEYREKFMTGAADPADDAVWAEFQKTLTALRVDEICSVYDAAYQRFAQRAK